MKAFYFRLQAVLTLREQAEQAAQRKCARAGAIAEAAAARLAAAEAEIAAACNSRQARLATGVRGEELQQLRAYLLWLEERKTRLRRELDQARRRAEEARRELLVARQRREGLERLRTSQRRVYDYETARADQKVLDELASRLPPAMRLAPVLNGRDS